MNYWFFLIMICSFALFVIMYSQFPVNPQIENKTEVDKSATTDIFEIFFKKMNIPAAQVRIIQNGNTKYSRNFSGTHITIWDKKLMLT